MSKILDTLWIDAGTVGLGAGVLGKVVTVGVVLVDTGHGLKAYIRAIVASDDEERDTQLIAMSVNALQEKQARALFTLPAEAVFAK